MREGEGGIQQIVARWVVTRLLESASEAEGKFGRLNVNPARHPRIWAWGAPSRDCAKKPFDTASAMPSLSEKIESGMNPPNWLKYLACLDGIALTAIISFVLVVKRSFISTLAIRKFHNLHFLGRNIGPWSCCSLGDSLQQPGLQRSHRAHLVQPLDLSIF
jgi:hypothetical protein